MKQVILIAALAGAASLLALSGPAPQPPSGPMLRGFKYCGATRCSARDCHGSDQPKGSPALNEAETWAKKDLHSKSFNQLFKKPSKDIAAGLSIKDASKDARCTACHTKVLEKADVVEGGTWVVQNGVSCEVCHGPGEKWCDLHADPKKNSWDHAKSVAGGMFDLRDAVTWANTCVACHLAIDHDLIAKGHPRLNFELIDYNDRMPPHWATKDHFSQKPEFTAKAWAVGAAVSMREAAKNYLARQKAGAPEAALKEADALVKAYHGVLRHVSDVGDPTPSDALVKKLDDLAKSIAAPGVDVVKKIAAEEPTGFDSARQIALALRALSGKAELKKLCDDVAAANRDKFDLAAFKKDLETARALFK